MGITAEYWGESGFSLGKRCAEHFNKLKYWDKSNPMLRHNVLYHSDYDPQTPNYMFEVKSFHQTAFMRQIDEAVKIADSKWRARVSKGKIINLNRKEEYARGLGRSLVPGLTDTPLSDEEEKRDNELTEKILRLAKTRKANQENPENPAPKRARRRRFSLPKPQANINDDEA